MISELEKISIPLAFQDCQHTRAKVVLCKDGARSFRVLNVTLDPIDVRMLPQQNISQFEQLYAQQYGGTAEELSFELMPSYDGKTLYFSRQQGNSFRKS